MTHTGRRRKRKNPVQEGEGAERKFLGLSREGWVLAVIGLLTLLAASLVVPEVRQVLGLKKDPDLGDEKSAPKRADNTDPPLAEPKTGAEPAPAPFEPSFELIPYSPKPSKKPKRAPIITAQSVDIDPALTAYGSVSGFTPSYGYTAFGGPGSREALLALPGSEGIAAGLLPPYSSNGTPGISDGTSLNPYPVPYPYSKFHASPFFRYTYDTKPNTPSLPFTFPRFNGVPEFPSFTYPASLPIPQFDLVTDKEAEALVVHRVEPKYPSDAGLAGISGPVGLLVHIKGDGTVASIEAVSGNPLLVEAAKKAVSQWTFRPRFFFAKDTEWRASIVVNVGPEATPTPSNKPTS